MVEIYIETLNVYGSFLCVCKPGGDGLLEQILSWSPSFLVLSSRVISANS